MNSVATTIENKAKSSNFKNSVCDEQLQKIGSAKDPIKHRVRFNLKQKEKFRLIESKDKRNVHFLFSSGLPSIITSFSRSYSRMMDGTLTQKREEEKKAFEDSAKLAVEAITNIRTVAGLRIEDKYSQMYQDLLAAPLQQNKKRSHMRGILFGFSQGIQYFSWGMSLWFGGYLVDIGEADYTEVFTVQNAIIGGAGMIGYAFAFVSDFNKAMVASARVFQLLDRKPLIDANPSTGLKMNDVNGNVDLKDAEFHYPTRPNIKILRRLQLSIKKGERIALVGESGCGKSTVIQVQFY